MMGSAGSRYESEFNETSRLERAAVAPAHMETSLPPNLYRDDNNQKIFDELETIVNEDKTSNESDIDDKEDKTHDHSITRETVSVLSCSAAADRYLVSSLEKREEDASTIQRCIIQGHFHLTRLKLQQMCSTQDGSDTTVIDTKRAYLLDKGGPNSLPVAIVQKQSALPCLIRHFSKANKTDKHYTAASVRKNSHSKFPNLNITASESDCLLASQ